LINRYTIGPVYINILHYLSMNYKGRLLRKSLRTGTPRYLAFEETPISLAESSTGEVLMKIAGRK